MKSLQEFLKWFKSKLGKGKFQAEERKIADVKSGKESSQVDDYPFKKETPPKAITRGKDKVYVQGKCIIAQGKDSEGITKASEKLAYYLLGII